MEETKETPPLPQPSMVDFKQPAGLAFEQPPRKAKEKKRCGDCKKTFIKEHFCSPKNLTKPGRRTYGEPVCQHCRRRYEINNANFRTHESKCKLYNTHLELKTLGDNRVKCKICYRIFAGQGTAFLHVEKTHANLFVDDKTVVNFNCELCKKTFRFHAALKQHMSKMHKEPKNAAVPVTQAPKHALEHVIQLPKHAVEPVIQPPKQRENEENDMLRVAQNQNRKCGFCSVLVSRQEFPEHFEKCRKASVYVQDTVCKICKLRWGTPCDALRHVIEDHPGNAQDVDANENNNNGNEQRALGNPQPIIQEPFQNPNRSS